MPAPAMSVIVNYLNNRVAILSLNAKTGMDTTTQQYEHLSNGAATANKHVCLGGEGCDTSGDLSPLTSNHSGPMHAQYRDELGDRLSSKLNNGMPISPASPSCSQVEFP